MNNKKTIGIILILVGIGLFIISFAFVKGYDNQDGFLGSLGQMEFILREVEFEKIKAEYPCPVCPENDHDCLEVKEKCAADHEISKQINEDIMKRRIALPYKYFFAVDIIIIFTGITFLILRKKSAD
jgi:hypothetical protein